MNIGYYDLLIIIGYFTILVAIGFFRSNLKKNASQNEYILHGRKLSLPGFVATLVSTWYGAILGIGENTYLYGIQTWFIFAFPYYFFAIILFFVFMDYTAFEVDFGVVFGVIGLREILGWI